MAKMQKVILTTITLMLLASVGYGADWKHFITGAKGNDWFYDTQSVSREQNTIIVRTKEVLSENEKAQFIKDYPDITYIKNISYILDRWEINCSKNTRKQLSSFWYSSEGNDIFSEYYFHSQFKKIVSESVLSELVAILCKEGEDGK
jgi:hypothetical protein